MSEEKSKTRTYMHLIILGITLSVLFATITYAGYSRLTAVNHESQQKFERSQVMLEAQFKKQLNLMTLKMDALSNKVETPLVSTTKDLSESRQQIDQNKQEIIIKHLNSQNKLISQILKHNDYLEKEMKKIKYIANSTNNDLSSNQNNVAAKTPEITLPTIEDLEAETLENNKQNEDHLKILEDQFLQSSSESHLVKVSTDQIVKAIDNYKIETNTDLHAENIDCRDSMCKIKINNLESEGMEMLGMQLTAGLGDDMSSFSISEFNDTNADGSVNKTFYLDFSN